MQLRVGRALGNVVLHHLARDFQGVGRTGFFGAHADGEFAFLRQWLQIAVGAIGIAAFVAQFLHQQAVKAARAQGVIADEQREVIGVVTREHGQAQRQVGLAGWVGDFGGLPAFYRHGSHGLQLDGLLWQTRQQRFRHGFGLAAIHVAHNRNHRGLRAEILCMETLQIGNGDGAYGFFSFPSAVAIGVFGIIQTRHGAAAQKLGVGFVLL